MRISLIEFYQKYLSIISPGKCRYYPSCSEYAKWSFKNDSFLNAFYKSFLRILRCNQLFPGGIDYPLITIKNISILYPQSGISEIEYWFVSYKNSSYYVIKSLNKG